MAEPFIKLKTPLGAALRLRSMSGTEEISRPFEYTVVASAKPEVAVVKLERVVVVGKRAAAPVVTASLPRVIVVGQSVARSNLQLASL